MSSEKMNTEYIEHPTRFGPDRVTVERIGTGNPTESHSITLNPTFAASVGDEIRKSWTHGGLPDRFLSTVAASGSLFLITTFIAVFAAGKSLWHLGEGLTNGRLLRMVDRIGEDMSTPVRFIVNMLDGIRGNQRRDSL